MEINLHFFLLLVQNNQLHFYKKILIFINLLNIHKKKIHIYLIFTI